MNQIADGCTKNSMNKYIVWAQNRPEPLTTASRRSQASGEVAKNCFIDLEATTIKKRCQWTFEERYYGIISLTMPSLNISGSKICNKCFPWNRKRKVWAIFNTQKYSLFHFCGLLYIYIFCFRLLDVKLYIITARVQSEFCQTISMESSYVI